MGFYDHFFERKGGGLLGRWKDSREDGKLLDHVRALCADPRIVEIGPGLGHFARHCKERGIDYEAVEANPGQVAFIRQMGVVVHNAIAPPIPLGDNYCDVLFASQVIEHMPHQAAAVELVVDAIRIVRPGGFVVLTAPNVLSWREFFWEDYTHNYPTTPRRLQNIFRDLQLTDLTIQLYVSSLFGWKRLLPMTLGAMLPYRVLDSLSQTSLKRGPIFNLKAATLERFVISGRVPHATQPSTKNPAKIRDSWRSENESLTRSIAIPCTEHDS